MPDEGKFDVESSYKVDVGRALFHTILNAPSIREQNEILERLQTEPVQFADIPKIPGVISFKDPHTYTAALLILQRMFPTLSDDIRETINHELDHFNEARNWDAENQSLVISFGVDDLKVYPDGSLSFHEVSLQSFNAFKLSDSLSAGEKELIDFHISHAPKNLSPWIVVQTIPR